MRRAVYERSTHTRPQVQFHTDEGFAGNLDGGVNHPDVGKIIGFSTTKQFGEASGSFSLTVKKPPKLGSRSGLRLWKDPEDVWVSIKTLCDGLPYDTFFGLVDTVNEETIRGEGGNRSETYSIHGRDFGKVFEALQVFCNLYDGGGVQSVLAIADPTATINGTPDRIVRYLIDKWVGNGGVATQQWQLPSSLGGTPFTSILNLENIQEMSDSHGTTIAAQLMHPDFQGAALWELMQEYSNPLLNEMWVDLTPAPGPGGENDQEWLTPAVFLRERCFKIRESTSRWDKLPLHVLNPWDISKRNISKGNGASRYNYWQLGINGFESEPMGLHSLQAQDFGVPSLNPGSYPIINLESIRKHGVRKWMQSTSFLPITDPNDERASTWLAVAANWLKRCHDWYSVAPYQLSGQLQTTRLMPEIRIGQRVLERRSEGDIIYYVEGVQHSWHMPGPGSTILLLTHGEYTDENVLDIVYKEFSVTRDRRPRSRVLADYETSTEGLIVDGESQDPTSLVGREVAWDVDNELEGTAPPARGIDDLDKLLGLVDPNAGARLDDELDRVLGTAAEGAAPAPTPRASNVPPEDSQNAHAQAVRDGSAQPTSVPVAVEGPPGMTMQTEGQYGEVMLTPEELEAQQRIRAPEDLSDPMLERVFGNNTVPGGG